MPFIYKPKDFEKTREYLIVKHYSDTTECKNSIDILTDNYCRFIDEIAKSKIIISSSLHGIILAESYGVPAILYIPKCMKQQLFKFKDYYFGTGRFDFPIAYSIEEALTMRPVSIPNFNEQRQQLIDSFPYDLWEI